ncbi:MAG: hypothetical protein VBE63_15070 [Lamprobacter sp.]|uniref:hypothetical protein n=1 Tax=Lamprobacter sp. TaxID=3100796 RepID=UPI002B2621AA|nr:hypothetical protein [Lamprobacter sp.]MEA3641244.1 hypothetical protein [Lamprobacter sp.]
MNCLSFRRQLLVDPQGRQADLQAHAAQCAPCARALQRALAFEASLKAALLLDYADGDDAQREDEPDDSGDAEARQPSRWRLAALLLILASLGAGSSVAASDCEVAVQVLGFSGPAAQS